MKMKFKDQEHIDMYLKIKNKFSHIGGPFIEFIQSNAKQFVKVVGLNEFDVDFSVGFDFETGSYYIRKDRVELTEHSGLDDCPFIVHENDMIFFEIVME
ncbi:hypothetical protein 65p362 [Aeromonas phage 65]|uniref:Uncharacterized protein n=1 Tax=Aeromonas phage 65 TaxID=2919549 RepID=E5DSJ6_9CAUD|nr:goF mRNA metabolism modulator [Aeromonas phage 65]ADQ53370.1 hypothetical protein 65p362 [Aeromonas phage 65]